MDLEIASEVDKARMKDTVPQIHIRRLEHVYDFSELTDQRNRYANLREEFKKLHGAEPDFIARAPGRVNLIGEHIDYEGYSVLPMALSLDVIVACGMRSEAHIHVSNVSKEVDAEDPTKPKYEAGILSIDPREPVKRGSWLSYVQAAYKGVLEYFMWKHRDNKAEILWPRQKGMNLMVDGRVPQGSGLSSSSALVCAIAIAVMHIKKMSFTKAEIAEFCRECEKYVGTQSGGMDQAISLMGEKGFAKLIDFNPVKAHSVPLPLGGIFVIANTVVASLKAKAPESKYNLRVVECTLAAVVLALALDVPKGEALKLKTLKEVQERMGDKKDSPLVVLEEKMHAEPYDRAELEPLMGVKLEALFKDNEDFLKAVKYGDANKGFQLYNRALHVYSEAARVYKIRQLCADDSKDKFQSIGRLMTESHRSCKTLYDCSSPELDELVKLAIENGAYGARLTGAGWGGCIVAYVSENTKNRFIEEIYRSYYKKNLDSGKFERSQLRDCIFPSKPSPGACIIPL
ncbi:galactokinase [Chloropicon primus]|uniref:Galactokinase n=2 Tax=Chloropicon primus TaxID=1764295 RepID=A0A5B8MCT3_9CHLO|nr:galactokinase [Chloropicon primus]UPQ97478.1 galactokinase [Chloropicon primus]|eukprot:QDZ18267.1 galactokinase [Chloropicon primus]